MGGLWGVCVGGCLSKHRTISSLLYESPEAHHGCKNLLSCCKIPLKHITDVEVKHGLESSSDCFMPSDADPEAQRGAVGCQGHSQDERHP